jgi:hypothetical protein
MTAAALPSTGNYFPKRASESSPAAMASAEGAAAGHVEDACSISLSLRPARTTGWSVDIPQWDPIDGAHLPALLDA